MRAAQPAGGCLPQPVLLHQAGELAAYLKTLSRNQLATTMKLSSSSAGTTYQLVQNWNTKPAEQQMAASSFLGDIYSGLQVASWTSADWDYADTSLGILSGLYGLLRPRDGIYPYRLEMGYKLPDQPFANLYAFWGDTIADLVPANGPVVDLAAAEYSKVITKHTAPDRLYKPTFLTVNPKTGIPTFVVVHAKIARGAYAHWLIKDRISTVDDLPKFADLGYVYDAALSSNNAPVFVCQSFIGLGLSVRLT